MVKIYFEGSSRDEVRARENLSILFRKMGLSGKMPRLHPSNDRNQAYNDFLIALKNRKAGEKIFLLVDSEDIIVEIENTWAHVKGRDDWEQPEGTIDEEVLLMATCMETWVCADPASVKELFGSMFDESKLPKHAKLEEVTRHEVYAKLEAATKHCPGPYKKGKRSFEAVGVLDPKILEQKLPSFKRIVRILTKG